MSKTVGYESKQELPDEKLLAGPDDKKKGPQDVEESKDEEPEQEKQNASERINLQHIMELREAFDIADTDKGGELDLDEFKEAFGEIIGKNMNMKQLNQLFMKIDADANGSVEWHEFMNYMLLENQTLSAMKQEHFSYEKSSQPDPLPHKTKLCHSDMITSILIIMPDEKGLKVEQIKRKMRYCTSSRDGTVKIWNAHTLHKDMTIKVTDGVWVTCTQYMTASKKLVAASANRMISFYDLTSTNYQLPYSRIEGLVGIPLCMEYYAWPPKNSEGKLETLLVGDDLGICHKYDFTKTDWHWCQYKLGSQNANNCHKQYIEEEFEQAVESEFNKDLQKKKEERKLLNKNKAAGQKTEAVVRTKPKPIAFKRHDQGVQYLEKLIHKGWITKIKFYPDLNYIISSSLDAFIHIHDIENLKYNGKTFNLHQKGVNSFIYSPKHRFVASCGEERHILMWDPFTLGVLSYLYGHNTSVQDLALNEDRCHLISLGTDKVVKIWNTVTYAAIQTIFDKVYYRPEDRLTSLLFDKYTNNIILGSRKINLWFFKTQEEIKTSHEYPVTFALNNGAFESVVSADDGGFIAVWDIEDGKLMSKFGNTHGHLGKITAGCFDSTQRRLTTAGSDGTCKMWNFSNGQCLTELKSAVTGAKIDPEITQVCCVFDPNDEEQIKMSYIISVGWSRKVHIWADEKEEEVETTKILTQNESYGHKDDIMSCVYCNYGAGLIYTGGHDGTLIAWNFETGYSKYYLHQYDKTCTSDSIHKAIKESKSVDCLVILEQRELLLSMTADQHLRFWNLKEQQEPHFKYHCNHPDDDSLSAVACTKDNNFLVTGDTSGQMKVWDITDVNLLDQTTKSKFIEKFFIIAHRAVINNIQIVEESNIKSDKFIITSSNDNNINLHRLSNGVFIGQFGQANGWNIHDMSPYENRKPRYVREWYLKLKAKMKAKRLQLEKEQEEAKVDGEQQVSSPDLGANKSPKKVHSDDGDSYDDGWGHEQSEYNDRLAGDMDFSDEEDIIGDGMVEIRNASKYLSYKPPQRNKNTRIIPKVDESRYFAAIEAKKPKIERANELKYEHKNLQKKYKKMLEKNRNNFSTDID